MFETDGLLRARESRDALTESSQWWRRGRDFGLDGQVGGAFKMKEVKVHRGMKEQN